MIAKLKNTLNGRNAQQNMFVFVFTVPTLLLFTWFVLVPTVQGLYYSLFSWSGLSSNMTFIGLKNYERMVNDSVVWLALWNDIKVALARVIFTLVISLGLALLLARTKVFGDKFFRNVLFFPVVLTAVVICTIWMMMYNSNFGIINPFLELFGIEAPKAGWLGDKNTALMSVVPPAVWCSVGFYLVIFLSAIESIPMTLYESALLDGANGLRQTFSIIIPLIRPQINFCVVYTVISSFNASYMFIDLLTKGGPNNASQVLGTYMTLNGFEYHKFGYATAIAMLILAATATMSAIMNRIFSSETYEY
ncbi:MAG: sugar ABC transporter permease [Eubacteriales bacterium]|nr:sugar ABC transporter permease [Eubacteriales bacterium]